MRESIAPLNLSWTQKVSGQHQTDNQQMFLGDLVRRSSLYMLGAASTSAGSFMMSMIIGRTMGAGGLGEYSICITASTIALLAADVGIDSMVMRTFACGSKETNHLFNQILAAKTAASICVATVLVSLLLNFGWSNHAAFVAAALLIVPRGISGTLESFLKARNQRIGVTLISVTSALLSVAAVAGTSITQHSVQQVLLVLCVVETVKAFVLAVLITAKTGITIRPAFFTFRALLRFLSRSLPFAALGIITYAGGRSDILMLGALRGQAVAGTYAAADRFLIAGNLLAFSLYGAVLPAFAGIQDIRKHKESVISALTLALLAGGAGAVVLTLSASFILAATFRFKESVGILRVLSFSIPALLCNTVLGAAVFSRHGEVRALFILAGASLVGLILNFLLIPSLGAMGSAVACIITESLTAGGYAYFYFWRIAR